jgi:hypothetical protein
MSAPSHPLDFWFDLECLSLPEATKPQPRSNSRPVYSVKKGSAFPWKKEERDPGIRLQPAKTHNIREFTIQAGIFHVSSLYKHLLQALGFSENDQQEVAKSRSKKSRLFDFQCDAEGRILPESFTLPLGVFVISRLIASQDGTTIKEIEADFDAFQIQWKQNFARRAGAQPYSWLRPTHDLWHAPESRQRLTWEWLIDCVNALMTDLGGDLTQFMESKDPFSCHVIARDVAEKDARKPEYEFKINQTTTNDTEEQQDSDDCIINSFFRNDLRTIAASPDDQWSPALKRYVYAVADAVSGASLERYDVRDEHQQGQIQEMLRPDRFPAGRWPSKHPLVRAQQFAVNTAYFGIAKSSGLFSVNGPLGTGKTTLLRDLFAAIITDRAAFLATLRSPKEAFADTITVKCGDSNNQELLFHPLKENFAQFSMLVASSNNGAVENITRELPDANLLDERYQESAQQLDYLRKEASMFFNNRLAWAWLSVPLGNATNRSNLARWIQGQPPRAVGQSPGQRSERSEGSETSSLVGFLPWLDQHQVHENLVDDKWQEAKETFNRAADQERTCRERLVEVANFLLDPSDLNNQLVHLWEQIDHVTKQIEALDRHLSGLEQTVRDLCFQCRAIETRFGPNAAQRLQACSGKGLLGRLSLLLPHRIWLSYQWDEVTKALQAATTNLHQARAERDDLDRNVLRTYRAQYNALIRKREAINSYLRENENLIFPPSNPEEREKWAPWSDQDWLDARAKLFLAALQLHRVFILCMGETWRSNLKVLDKWLNRSAKIAALPAFTALSMLFPVVSTTFASVQTFLPQMPPGSIGWLFIDEAGQAVPEAPVGALHRSSRVVMVGDPMQLRPIPPLPGEVEAKLAKRMEIQPYWQPSRVSAQVLADQANQFGTWLSVQDGTLPDVLYDLGSTGEKRLWVGSPLRVHRRCLNPMFTISNMIAYGGLMVQGRVAGDEDEQTKNLPESHWLSVAVNHQGSNWIPEEGEALCKLLDELIGISSAIKHEIFLISPFRDVVRHLKQEIMKSYGLDWKKVGTVHVTQGKESKVVILVLGGGSKGSRNWAAESPHLLNVAVSRARERLYVVGNADDWGSLPFFNIALEHLPKSVYRPSIQAEQPPMSPSKSGRVNKSSPSAPRPPAPPRLSF